MAKEEEIWISYKLDTDGLRPGDVLNILRAAGAESWNGQFSEKQVLDYLGMDKNDPGAQKILSMLKARYGFYQFLYKTALETIENHPNGLAVQARVNKAVED